MKGLRILNECFTDEVKSKIVTNIEYKIILSLNYVSVYDFLTSAFTWSETPEGFTYWSTMCSPALCNHMFDDDYRPIKSIKNHIFI